MSSGRTFSRPCDHGSDIHQFVFRQSGSGLGSVEATANLADAVADCGANSGVVVAASAKVKSQGVCPR